MVLSVTLVASTCLVLYTEAGLGPRFLTHSDWGREESKFLSAPPPPRIVGVNERTRLPLPPMPATSAFLGSCFSRPPRKALHVKPGRSSGLLYVTIHQEAGFPRRLSSAALSPCVRSHRVTPSQEAYTSLPLVNED
uniref:Uncharacterized protein n=1 Tax=Rousettus aegyptiacus TaxID=9407 RepID=A0A7J8FKB0_ROUAE|nr:hypothetical protein HJG63_012007 [Rousettus aegyptiacus]